VLILRVPSSSSPAKGLYNPKAFVTHAASLDQACAHCPRFPTAASRRSLGRVSVPVWPATLSGRLRIAGTVGRYPTVDLIRRGPLPGRSLFPPQGISGISRSFPRLSRTRGQVPTRYAPVRHSRAETRASDLHVLSAPPAFVLSQDQTLSFIPVPPPPPRRRPRRALLAQTVRKVVPRPRRACGRAADNPLLGCAGHGATPSPAHPFPTSHHVKERIPDGGPAPEPPPRPHPTPRPGLIPLPPTEERTRYVGEEIPPFKRDSSNPGPPRPKVVVRTSDRP
jgi:hypothetical protein